MYYTSLDYLDRLQAKNVLTGTTATFLGVFATLVLIAGTAAFYVPTIVSYFQGIYFQSEFQLQQPPYGNITTNRDFKAALVFYNKTSNQIANHTLIKQNILINTFVATPNVLSTTLKTDTVITSCDTNYFSNALNPPPNFTDCFTFPPYSKIDITYLPSNGYLLFGFFAYTYCLDPFRCSPSSTGLLAYQNNFASIFNNFTYTIYFTSRVLQPNGIFME